MRATSACLLLACSLANADDPKTEEPRFVCTLTKKDDVFRYVGREKKGVLQITSASGIGKASITRQSGAWPDPLTIRLTGLTSLEGFTLRLADVTLEASLGREDQRVIHYDAKGKPTDDAKAAPFTLTLMRQRTGMDVLLAPASAWEKVPTLRCEWIDAYRR